MTRDEIDQKLAGVAHMSDSAGMMAVAILQLYALGDLTTVLEALVTEVAAIPR